VPEEPPEIAEARRRGEPFLSYLDAHDRVQCLSLVDTWKRASIGRGPSADLGLPWDSEVSRVHAELIRVADDWTVVDDGLSENGTFLNGDRIERRRRLRDGDELRCGSTVVTYHAPFEPLDRTQVSHRQPD
jgi:predicted component of type VI protein secretion system